MAKSCIEFEKLDSVTADETSKGKIRPVQYHFDMQMLFGINMDGKINRKGILVENGHTTAPPLLITYSSVVSRESVGIVFLLASLNDLKIFEYEIGNACLNTN